MSDDRTNEFLSLARSLPPTLTKSSTPAVDKSSSNDASYSELRSFHVTAGGISRDIAATSALLQELADRVRHKSLVSDHDSGHVDHLVVRIKTSIENLNARLDQAGVSIQRQKRTLGKNSQAAQESANLVDGLKNEFAHAATGFKKVLQERTDTMKQSNDFQRQVYGVEDEDEIPNMSALSAPPPVYDYSDQYSLGGGVGTNNHTQMNNTFPTMDLTSGMMAAGEPSGSSLPRPHGISPSRGYSSDSLNGGRGRRAVGSPGGLTTMGSSSTANSYLPYAQHEETAPLTPLDIQRMDEESGGAMQMQLIPDQDYLQQRADAMGQVEENIVELGTIFNKLAVMVNEHREMVQRVEDNVEDANANVNLSLSVLTDTLTSLRTNRQLALRVLSVLVAFIIAFVIFAA